LHTTLKDTRNTDGVRTLDVDVVDVVIDAVPPHPKVVWTAAAHCIPDEKALNEVPCETKSH
jgi:hypothetical protein